MLRAEANRHEDPGRRRRGSYGEAGEAGSGRGQVRGAPGWPARVGPDWVTISAFAE